MNWKEFATDYLSFTRKDRIAILIIVLIMLGVILAPVFITNSRTQRSSVPDTAWISSMKKLELKERENNSQQYSRENKDEEDYSYHYDRTKGNYFDKQKGELFYFDPNTLSEDGWKKLGLRDKTIQTIKNYLSKGGHFKKPEDLQKVYGLHKDEYERIANYIKIEIANNDIQTKSDVQIVVSPSKNITSRYISIDINAADTTAFISLPGIGSKLAARIINFRDKLGGFYTVAQVGETFGLPDSTFQKIKQYLKLESTSVKKININSATIDELKSHPYIKYSIANPIIAYRNEHGPFTKVEDIKKVMIVTDEIYNKISPYISTQ